MGALFQKTVKRLFLWILLPVLITACGGLRFTETATLSQSPTPTENLSGLSPEAVATLGSLEKVDNYPLYVMHYVGETNRPQTGWIWPEKSDFACSLFASFGQGSDLLFGRNFDWEFSPALLLFTDPPDGYAAVAMVDLTFLGISPTAAESLIDLPLADRTALLSAPSMPFDGMNEYGLTIAMAAVPEETRDAAGYDWAKPTIGSIGIIREILDHARNVDEAVSLFEQYNIDFTGGPPLHYLIADTFRKAVLVEFYQGEMVILPNEAPWHLATNHLRCNAKDDGGCPRYHILSERLTIAEGHLDAEAALQLLSEVAQSGTQWSVVYNITSGDVSIVSGKSYDTVFTFQLNRENP